MKDLNLLSAALFAGLALLASAAWSLSALGQEAPATVALPNPTGPFAVGRAIYEWTDSSRDEILSDVEGERRSLVIWIWYPAETSDAPLSAYMPGGLGDFVEQVVGVPARRVQVPARDDAPLAETGGRMPVLIFSHGSGSATAIYTTMLTEMASHGYVVVAIQHPYNALMTTFADGRAIPASPLASKDTVQYWSEDTAFVVDELERLAMGTSRFGGRLDLDRLGAFGHSFGGAATAEFCLNDSRCLAGINFDGSLSGDAEKVGVTRPFMQVFSGTTCEEVAASGAMTLDECRPQLALYRLGWQRVFDISEAGYRVSIAGARHGSFSDLQLFAPLAPIFADPLATVTPERTIEISTRFALAFFDRHLNAGDAPFPDFPEAVLEEADKR